MKRFSNTKKITKENLASVPSDQPGVYRIIDAKGEIMYIGKARASRLDKHIWEHRGALQKGTQFQYRTTKDKETADYLQRQEIRKLLSLPYRRI